MLLQTFLVAVTGLLILLKRGSLCSNHVIANPAAKDVDRDGAVSRHGDARARGMRGGQRARNLAVATLVGGTL